MYWVLLYIDTNSITKTCLFSALNDGQQGGSHCCGTGIVAGWAMTAGSLNYPDNYNQFLMEIVHRIASW